MLGVAINSFYVLPIGRELSVCYLKAQKVQRAFDISNRSSTKHSLPGTVRRNMHGCWTAVMADRVASVLADSLVIGLSSSSVAYRYTRSHNGWVEGFPNLVLHFQPPMFTALSITLL